MWFFKGFAQGIGMLIVISLLMMMVGLIVWLPMFACKEIFGDYGILIGMILEFVMISGLMGAWTAYECRDDEGDLPPPSA